MKLHFDLTNGISGDMVLGALLDTGLVKVPAFMAELDKLSIRNEFEIVVREDYKKNTRCKTVVVLDRNMFGGGGGGAEQSRTFKDILRVIMGSGFSDTAKLTAVKIFENLARAEGRASGKPPLTQEFSSGGGIAAVVNVCGVAILLDMIAPERITASRVNTGSGMAYRGGEAVEIPVPAVIDLLNGVEVYRDERECELTTAEGAAIAATVADDFSCIIPEGCIVAACGRGGGERDFVNYANVLTVTAFEDEAYRSDLPAESGTAGESAPFASFVTPAPVQNLETTGGEDAAEDNSSVKKIDQIMSAMEDLEQAMKQKRSAEKKAEPEEKPDMKLTQSILLGKLREIEGKLTAASRGRDMKQDRTDTNDSLQKLAALEHEFKGAVSENPTAVKKTEFEVKQSAETSDITSSGVLELTANIDNSTGEELGFLAELIMANGAFDVYFEPIYMKKFRPAYKLSAIVAEKDLTLFSRLILRHSGTIGVRYTRLNNITLKKEVIVKDSPFGEVKFKHVEQKGDYPVYEEKKRIALERDLTLREIDRILDAAEDKHEE